MSENYQLVASDGNIYCIGSRSECEKAMANMKACRVGGKGNTEAKCATMQYVIKSFDGEYPTNAPVRLGYKVG